MAMTYGSETAVGGAKASGTCLMSLLFEVNNLLSFHIDPWACTIMKAYLESVSRFGFFFSFLSGVVCGGGGRGRVGGGGEGGGGGGGGGGSNGYLLFHCRGVEKGIRSLARVKPSSATIHLGEFKVTHMRDLRRTKSLGLGKLRALIVLEKVKIARLCLRLILKVTI